MVTEHVAALQFIQSKSLRSWPFRGRLNGAELVEETVAVLADKGFDALVRVGADDQTGVVVAVETPDDFGGVVVGGVGLLLTGETDDASSVALLRLRQSVLHVKERGDLHSGPFDPWVDTGGEVDDLGDVGAADAGRGF